MYGASNKCIAADAENGTGIQRCAAFWRRRSYRYEFTDCLSSASEVDSFVDLPRKRQQQQQ